MRVQIFTDGSANNQGGDGSPGGWAVVYTTDQGHYREKSGIIQHPDARPTNQQMELQAVTSALEGVRKPKNAEIESIEVFTDSEYVCKMALARKVKANIFTVEAMWDALKEAKKIAPVQVKHIPGHSGHKHQERAHTLAYKAYSDALTRDSTGQVPEPGAGELPPAQEESHEEKADREFREKMEKDREYRERLAQEAEQLLPKLDPEKWGDNAIALVKLLRDPAARFYPYLSQSVPGDEPRVRVNGKEAWLRSVVGDYATIIYPHKLSPNKRKKDGYDLPDAEHVDFSCVEPITERNTGV